MSRLFRYLGSDRFEPNEIAIIGHVLLWFIQLRAWLDPGAGFNFPNCRESLEIRLSRKCGDIALRGYATNSAAGRFLVRLKS